jgi:hypothetical protein
MSVQQPLPAYWPAAVARPQGGASVRLPQLHGALCRLLESSELPSRRRTCACPAGFPPANPWRRAGGLSGKGGITRHCTGCHSGYAEVRLGARRRHESETACGLGASWRYCGSILRSFAPRGRCSRHTCMRFPWNTPERPHLQIRNVDDWWDPALPRPVTKTHPAGERIEVA